jgi:hypothetical protein
MPRLPTRPALVLLGALLCLAACTPTATVSVGPTATTPPYPTALPTATLEVAPAPTPTNVPAGWSVLAGLHLSLAYPPEWAVRTIPPHEGLTFTDYILALPANSQDLFVVAQVQPRAADLSPYCAPGASWQRATLAGLPMAFAVTGAGRPVRAWTFANAQHTLYTLYTDDTQADAATQAQDEAILATFRPDNATPWRC